MDDTMAAMINERAEAALIELMHAHPELFDVPPAAISTIWHAGVRFGGKMMVDTREQWEPK